MGRMGLMVHMGPPRFMFGPNGFRNPLGWSMLWFHLEGRGVMLGMAFNVWHSKSKASTQMSTRDATALQAEVACKLGIPVIEQVPPLTLAWGATWVGKGGVFSV